MKVKMETNQQQLLDAQSQLQQVETARNQLEFDMQELRQSEENAQSMKRTLTAEIESSKASIEELRKQLHTSKLGKMLWY